MKLFKVIFWSGHEYSGTNTLLTHENKTDIEFDEDVREFVEAGTETLIEEIEDYLVHIKGYKRVECKVHNTAVGVQT